MQRSLLLFENSIRSEHSRKMYKYYLDGFLGFSKIKDYDSLVSLDTDTIQMLLENYVIHLKDRKLKAKSIKNYLSGIELFFDINKKTYYKRVLQKLIPEGTKEGNDKPYTTKDIQMMLEVSNTKREKALVHFFASTGARPRVLLDPVLRLRHLYPMADGCKGVLLYENSKDEYWAFLTQEAVKTLDQYLDARRQEGEDLTSESPVFANNIRVRGQKKVKPLTYGRLRNIMVKILKKSNVERIKTGYRYDKAVYTGYRKRFNGILKMNNSVNSNIAEKLMAHKKGLDGVYLKPTREQCFAEFHKSINELVISDEERQKVMIEEKEKKITELESEKDKRLDELEQKQKFYDEQIKMLYSLLDKTKN